MKVSVNTILNSENGILKFNCLGILSNNKLQFVENDVKVLIDLDNNKMIREDKDKKLVYNFLENEETLNDVFIKDLNRTISIKILTEIFKIESNSCFIKYKLIDDDLEVSYQISWEEVK